MKTQFFNPPYSDDVISYCVNELKKGNIGIFPTDTVYGIGCDALNTQAIQDLYGIKNRDLNKPINILISNINMINKFVNNTNDIEQKLMNTFWPGALTIIFDKSIIVPNLLTSGLSTVGIRMPNDKICLDIIDKFGSPLAMSSANLSDESPAISINEELIDTFNNKVSFVIDGGFIDSGLPSTIVRVENNEIIILREGSITKSDIEKCFGGNINVR